MKVIVAGSRHIEDWEAVHRAIRESGWKFTELVSGGAQGVDSLAVALAELHGVPVKVFPVDWKKFRKSAGPIRNTKMAHYADALVAVWDGESPGTADMIRKMKNLGKPVSIYMYQPEEDQDE